MAVRTLRSCGVRIGPVLTAMCAVVLMGVSQRAIATPLCWDANGHCYERVDVPEGISWYDARLAAEAKGGHLATVTSKEENDFIVNSLGGSDVLCKYWLGGFQPAGSAEPDAGWEWITGEPFNFTNWAPGEPNNSYANDLGNLPGVTDEDGLQFYPWCCGDLWNDAPRAAYLIPGFMLELEGTTFSAFSPGARLEIGPTAHDDSFKITGTFTLDGDSDGIDPYSDVVRITLGASSITIPPGSFNQAGQGVFTFCGTVDGVDLSVIVARQPAGHLQQFESGAMTYGFLVEARHATLDGTVLPLNVALSIGDDRGQASLGVGEGRFGAGDDGVRWLSGLEPRPPVPLAVGGMCPLVDSVKPVESAPIPRGR